MSDASTAIDWIQCCIVAIGLPGNTPMCLDISFFSCYHCVSDLRDFWHFVDPTSTNSGMVANKTEISGTFSTIEVFLRHD
eukprot:scaffold624_cov150-Cylindrotheca_fusiformis.AAC.5